MMSLRGAALSALPPVERCILRAATLEDFQTVMGKPVGEFSLQGALALAHTQLHLGQRIPATDSYPSLTVEDLTPATTCELSATVAATVIVLPPPRASKSTQKATTVDSVTEDAAPDKQEVISCVVPSVRVCIDVNLRDGRGAMASPALLTELLVPDGALVRVGDEEGGCTFTVRTHQLSSAEDATGPSTGATTMNQKDRICDDGVELCLWVSPMLFRNIRAAYAKRRLFTFPGADPLSYAVSSLTLSLDFLEVVEDAKGEAVVAAPDAGRVLLCPAVDDFTLTNMYGDRYADVLTVGLAAAAASHLDGCLVSEGDVLRLPLCAEDVRSGVIGATDGLDVAETLQAHVAHKIAEGDTLWAEESSHAAPTPLTLFRVVEVRPVSAGGAETVVGCGVLRFGAFRRSAATEIALVSQQRAPWADPTPLLPPLRAPTAAARLPEMEFQAVLREAIARCAIPSDTGICGGTLVVHGVAENFSSEFSQAAVRQVGLVPVLVAADAIDDAEEMRALLGNFASLSQGVALIVRNAHTLTAGHPELLSLVGSSSGAKPGMRVLILVCEAVDPVVPAIAARATNVEGVLECGNPSESDRRHILQYCMESAARRDKFLLSMPLSFDAMAGWTVGISFADLVAFARDCAVAATRVRYADPVVRPVLSEQVCESVLQRYLKDHGHLLVSTKLTPVRWSDVGGLEDAKRELKETIQLPILHPEMFANGMKRRTGILFYGPPGCGKTLLAKAVATEMNMNFMSVKGPELINQYVGESERHIRLLFQRARDNSPCIVFFDELDALAPARGAKGDAGGAMDRIVSQLLVEVDGVGQTRSDGSSSGDVFIIGATNRPDLLDPSLLRPGRFDRLCYLGIPSTREEQMFAMKALTRKFELAPDVDLAQLLEPLDFVYTGADFFALCSDAMMFSVEDALEAAKADIERVAATQVEDDGDTLCERLDWDGEGEEEAAAASASIKVSMSHFIRARDQLKPSVTKEDLKKYEALKAKFNN